MSKAGQAIVVRGNALKLPLPDESVDLIVTSPPYFALRSYRDSGDHYAGQIGSEPTPQEWLEALWACMAEWWRVLKPTGSVFVNLGDKRVGSGGHNNSGVSKSKASSSGLQGGPQFSHQERAQEPYPASRRNAPDRYNQAAFGRAKSKMMLPHRFAIGCEDGLADPEGIGWIMRQDLVWQKLNGLPESVTDRHRDSHEFIFHFTKQDRYFAAMDEIREAQVWLWDVRTNGRGPDFSGNDDKRNDPITQDGHRGTPSGPNRLGKAPGSVWPMASEPLIIPQWAREKFDLPQHFAAFPSELPRKLILGFSPSGICVECGAYLSHERYCSKRHIPPSRPAVILDPFCGTGTVPMVAKQLGRIGLGIDLSSDYCRLSQWRIANPPSKVMERTWRERQGSML